MSKAAELAVADAGLNRADIDGGPPAALFHGLAAHHCSPPSLPSTLGIRPAYAHAVQVGGATGTVR